MYIKKIIIALTALVVCLSLLVTASFAWLTMSKAPEVSGIQTQVGANGSLEIALLSTSTYIDPSLIRSSVGGSAAISDPTSSNVSWGNMIDLSDPSYGMSEIALRPTRLNVWNSNDGRTVVGNNILVFPEYGADGRFESMFADSVSAVCADSKFLYSTEKQSYGVRAIGTVPHISIQQSALVTARSAVRSYTTAALSTTESMWKANGASLLALYYEHYAEGKNVFPKADIAVIRDTADRMMDAISYLDLALRQAIVGEAAALVADPELFRTVRETVENTNYPLSIVLAALPVDLPSEFLRQVELVEADALRMYRVIYACDLLTAGQYPWTVVSPLLDQLINANEAYLGETRLSAINSSTHLSADQQLSLTPNVGVMATISDYAGVFRVFFQYSERTSVEVVSYSGVGTPYLETVAAELDGKTAADDDGSTYSAPLEDIYGFAVDLAFRCNAQASDLLLQTSPIDRIEEPGALDATGGNGSYMCFSSEQMSELQIVTMMDSIRIGFVDNQQNLVALAKLNTSNYVVTEEGIRASLYLYEFTVSVDGSISMGERRTEDNVITSLPGGEPLILTAIVWLDGDNIGNSLTTITPKTLTGSLNLQFASSAELNPANVSRGNGN